MSSSVCRVVLAAWLCFTLFIIVSCAHQDALFFFFIIDFNQIKCFVMSAVVLAAIHYGALSSEQQVNRKKDKK